MRRGEVFVHEVVRRTRRRHIGVAGSERCQMGRHDLATRVHQRDGIGARMWSNVAVADEDPDETSPWTRDDWVPDSGAPGPEVFVGSPDGPVASGPLGAIGDQDEPPAEDFDDRHASSSSRSSLGRKVVAAAVVAALLIGSAGALLREGGEPEGAPTTTEAGDRSLMGTLPADSSSIAADVERATLPPATVLTVTAPPSDGSGDLIAIADPIPAVVVGESPPWSERLIDVPENLSAMAPTEVITLSQAGIVNVTEFPTGRNRSIDVSELGAQVQLAVGDRTIVAFNSTTLLMIRDTEPVIESTLADGVVFVQPWTGTGDFVVTAPAIGPETRERNWLLRSDATLEPLESRLVDETPFFSRVFSPEGDALVTAPGGVYAISPDGSGRRFSSGALVATGKRHWAIEECDETLRCAYSIIEWDTGAVTPGVLDRIDTLGFVDPATHISPDGRSIVFRADDDGSGRREILDLESGATLAAGRINQLAYPDAWANDSSGVFVADRFVQFVDRQTGVITEIEGLDRIRTVATGAFAA